MNPRTTRLLLILSAFIAGLVLCFAVVLLVTGRGPSPLANPTAAIGGPFKLTDQNGSPISDRDLKGRPFLVFFGFTHCPEVCPTALAEISQVMDKLGPDAEKVNALFVTVDPERDTPAVLKDYLTSFNPRLLGVGGDADALAAVAKAYRVYYKKVPLKDGDYTMDHTAIVYLMDKNGQFVSPFNLRRRPEELAAELRRYL
jgi:protein SCO1/2